MNVADFVNKYPFSNPLQRLILLKILMSGSLNGEGERVLDHEVLANFCCCSKPAMFRESKKLERLGFLSVRRIGGLTSGLKVRLEPARGYTIIPANGGKK